MSRKTIIITGASSGIGKATKQLLEKDYNIVNLSRSTGFDLSNIKSLKSIEKLRYEDIYGVVNNAAICKKKSIEETTLDDLYEIVNLNLLAPFLLSKIFISDLRKTNGSIVNISSIHAVSTIKNNSIYASTKAGLESLTRSMALEFAPDVRVNCIRPGSVMTPMLPYERKMKEDIPLKRVAEPFEVAKVIKFLLSEESSYITGECITVDGGILAKLSVSK